MRNTLLLLFALLCSSATLGAQELLFSVKINAQKLQTVDPAVFTTLEQTITEFLNNTKWTDDNFENDERIRCNLQLTIQEELSPTSFKADLAIQSSRPIYNSTYETAMLNHLDKEVTFSYEQYQPLQFSRNTYNDNLSAVLSYYVYVILGLDYDSFSLYGGEPYFQMAQDIVNSVPQGAGGSGWRSVESNQNRYWLIENLLSPRVRPYREAMYNYHRYGLDVAADDVSAGRAVIVTALEDVQKVFQNYPNAMIVRAFVNAKSSEVVEIFKRGTNPEKDQVVRIMTRIDAPNATNYRSIR